MEGIKSLYNVVVYDYIIIMTNVVTQTSTSSSELMERVFENWKVENEKFESGNNAAGTRARKALQELTVLAKNRRAEISATRNQRKGL